VLPFKLKNGSCLYDEQDNEVPIELDLRVECRPIGTLLNWRVSGRVNVCKCRVTCASHRVTAASGAAGPRQKSYALSASLAPDASPADLVLYYQQIVLILFMSRKLARRRRL
jgi:hypothetical protein